MLGLKPKKEGERYGGNSINHIDRHKIGNNLLHTVIYKKNRKQNQKLSILYIQTRVTVINIQNNRK